MKLSRIIADIDPLEIKGDPEIEVSNIVNDSRDAGDGDLFICITGFNTDGHKYIDQAYSRGTRIFVIEREIENYRTDCTYIFVKDSRKAMGYIASAFYNYPLRELKLIGVTGTNGKTTTTFLIKSILEHVGNRVGLIGTIEVQVPGNSYPSTRTTPESLELYHYFREMVDRGVTHVVMEVSSHALDLNRVAGMEFDASVFTNISRDHLDYHESIKDYLRAKCRLFEIVKPEGYGIVNLDDKYSEEVCDSTRGDILTYGITGDADFRSVNISVGPEGASFCLNGKDFCVDLNLTGRFNVYNALASIAVSRSLGVNYGDIRDGLEGIKGVPGRFELIKEGQNFSVVVDYAHTPDGMKNVLDTARNLAKNRVIVVFGCGGDRDRSKRSVMGRLGAELADYSIITSDNPRSEDEEDIIAQIERGIEEMSEPGTYDVFIDRREAIFRAVEEAREGDMVLIIGKGHETYQVFKDKTIHFDDREVAREALRERG
ncbi:MAG: UDP-N-acetylmuramoyl-L-alanyl-D-glutamate--2,6-diaminopimelate ligase [Halanaerobiaceae bacterium]